MLSCYFVVLSRPGRGDWPVGDVTFLRPFAPVGLASAQVTVPGRAVPERQDVRATHPIRANDLPTKAAALAFCPVGTVDDRKYLTASLKLRLMTAVSTWQG